MFSQLEKSVGGYRDTADTEHLYVMKVSYCLQGHPVTLNILPNSYNAFQCKSVDYGPYFIDL